MTPTKKQVVEEKLVYLVLATLATDIQIQERLNELAAEGYRVVAMSDRWIVLERVEQRI